MTPRETRVDYVQRIVTPAPLPDTDGLPEPVVKRTPPGQRIVVGPLLVTSCQL